MIYWWSWQRPCISRPGCPDKLTSELRIEESCLLLICDKKRGNIKWGTESYNSSSLMLCQSYPFNVFYVSDIVCCAQQSSKSMSWNIFKRFELFVVLPDWNTPFFKLLYRALKIFKTPKRILFRFPRWVAPAWLVCLAWVASADLLAWVDQEHTS